jgi:hypothetical protein
MRGHADVRMTEIGLLLRDRIRPRALATPSALALLVLAALLARAGTSAVAMFVLLLLGLLLTVGIHLRLQPPLGQGAPAGRPLLRTPAQVGLGLAAVVVAGSLVAIVVSIVLAAFATPLVGDGSLLLRVSLAVFALGPCMSIGYRCGRWWACLGSAGLAPVFGICVLIVGPRSWSGAGFAVLAVTGVALAVAAGSLQRALAGAGVSSRARSSSRSRPSRASTSSASPAGAPERRRAAS